MLWIYYCYFGLVFINIKLFLCFLSHFISLERASRSAELSGKTFYLRRIPSRYLECLFSSKRSLSIKRVNAANVGLHVPKATVATHLPSSLPVNLQVFIPSITQFKSPESHHIQAVSASEIASWPLMKAAISKFLPFCDKRALANVMSCNKRSPEGTLP